MVVWACLCVGGASENFLLKTRYINSLFDWLIDWLLCTIISWFSASRCCFSRLPGSLDIQWANNMFAYVKHGRLASSWNIHSQCFPSPIFWDLILWQRDSENQGKQQWGKVPKMFVDGCPWQYAGCHGGWSMAYGQNVVWWITMQLASSKIVSIVWRLASQKTAVNWPSRKPGNVPVVPWYFI